ncbi:hypothetical protein DENSPDRAFT_885473 [Dentipellis sp. KUC8613]|nr:hypothetical protein DENSPDRAFT_885473 [Dentipellis sp. KUC8613]
MPDLTEHLHLTNFILVSNAVVFSSALWWQELDNKSENYAMACVDRVEHMVAYLLLMEHYVANGYGTVERQQWEDRYEFFRQCNLQFAKSMLTYAVTVDESEDVALEIPVQKMFGLLRTDLRQMWGHDSDIVQAFDDYATDIDNIKGRVCHMCPSHVRWTTAVLPANAVPRPQVPLINFLPPRKRTCIFAAPSEGPARKKARRAKHQATSPNQRSGSPMVDEPSSCNPPHSNEERDDQGGGSSHEGSQKVSSNESGAGEQRDESPGGDDGSTKDSTPEGSDAGSQEF